MKIEVTSCLSCPFGMEDMEYGLYGCWLNDNINKPFTKQLPHYKVHEDCPLKTNDVTVKLNHERKTI